MNTFEKILVAGALAVQIACGGGPSGPSGGGNNLVPYTIAAPIIGNVSGNLGTHTLTGVIGTASTLNKSDISSKVPNMYGSEIFVSELNGNTLGKSLGKDSDGSTSYTVTDATKPLVILVIENMPGANYACSAIQDGATFNKSNITISRGQGNIYGSSAPNVVVQDGTPAQWQEWKDNLAEADAELAVGGIKPINLTQQADFSNSDIKYGFIGIPGNLGNHSVSGNAISVNLDRGQSDDIITRKAVSKAELLEALVGPQANVNDWGRSCGDNYTNAEGNITSIAKALTLAAVYRTNLQ